MEVGADEILNTVLLAFILPSKDSKNYSNALML